MNHSKTSDKNERSFTVLNTDIDNEYCRDKKSVSFGSVEIREYNLILGHHTSCTKGPPIALGTQCLKQERMNIDMYEDLRNRRHPLQELKLDASYRRELLQYVYGYSEREILEKEIEIKKEREIQQMKVREYKRRSRNECSLDTRFVKTRVKKRSKRLSLVRRHARKRMYLNKGKNMSVQVHS